MRVGSVHEEAPSSHDRCDPPAHLCRERVRRPRTKQPIEIATELLGWRATRMRPRHRTGKPIEIAKESFGGAPRARTAGDAPRSTRASEARGIVRGAKPIARPT